MLRKPLLLCTAGFVFALGACKDSTGLSSVITQDDANDLAAAMDAMSALGTNDVGLGPSFSMNVGENGSASVSAAPIAIDNQFSVTKQCPQGGSVVIAGRTTGSGDRVTHDLALHTVATKTDASCAFQTRHGVLTVSGNPNVAYDGSLNIVAGQLSGLQTQTHIGSFTWARNAASGTCDVNLASSYNPATQTATVTGTFCGLNINVSRTRS
jgi:hypothetical protein